MQSYDNSCGPYKPNIALLHDYLENTIMVKTHFYA